MYDEILIDPDAARADIAKLKSAISELKASQNGINKLRASASDMKGQTGTAITEKCEDLNRQIRNLISSLETTIGLIQSAVREYQEKERQLAAAFRRGGI